MRIWAPPATQQGLNKKSKNKMRITRTPNHPPPPHQGLNEHALDPWWGGRGDDFFISTILLVRFRTSTFTSTALL